MSKLRLFSLSVATALAIVFSTVIPAHAVGQDNDSTVVDQSRAYSQSNICEFHQHGDKPHISSSFGPKAVHIHGWWEKDSCVEATKAVVTVHCRRKQEFSGLT